MLLTVAKYSYNFDMVLLQFPGKLLEAPDKMIDIQTERLRNSSN